MEKAVAHPPSLCMWMPGDKKIILRPTSVTGVYETSFRGTPYVITKAGFGPKETWDSVFVYYAFETGLREEWWDVKIGDVVLDIGAAYGSYTLPALAKGASLVIALEPDREMFFGLSTQALANGFTERLLALPCLAGDYLGIATYSPENHSSVMMKETTELRIVLTIDRLAEVYQLQKLDWVKVDVDGAEVLVIKGALATLEKLHPKLLTENHVEFVPDVREQLQALLLPLGYTEENQTKSKGTNENWSLWTWEGT